MITSSYPSLLTSPAPFREFPRRAVSVAPWRLQAGVVEPLGPPRNRKALPALEIPPTFAKGSPVRMSPYPSPFTSPAPATTQPNPVVTQAGDVASPEGEPR